ncbi:hypothetical protein [Bathymodiolus japonicus methanotrophic gill symbiont]|uniref:hypothetical protein n=1 Tax=Bathymodiolus japonicus methanotrophic gill symbiont TaxID=113269 RepID=UPI001C8D8CDC|nr:hypothetical protein [Bathymodiolus japonicus methanotrophic gill symbiont]
MGDALNALRPQRLRTKAASSLTTSGYSECNSCSSRVLLAHVESANCPVAYQGLKITTSLSSVSMIFSGRDTHHAGEGCINRYPEQVKYSNAHTNEKATKN